MVAMNLTSLVALLFSATVASVPQGRVATPAPDLSPGRVAAVPLKYFVPEKAEHACNLLQQGRILEAGSLLDTLAEAEPKDLAIYVAWCQSQLPSLLLVESKRHQAAFEKDSLSVETRSKLACALFYQWIALSDPRERAKQIGLREQAAGLMQSVWKEHRSPIVGIMLAEISERAFPADTVVRPMMERLLHDLGGNLMYSQYVSAKKRNWVEEDRSVALLPAISGLSRTDLRALDGIVGKLWSIAGARFGSPMVKNGRKTIQWRERMEAQEAEVRFLSFWRATIRSATIKS